MNDALVCNQPRPWCPTLPGTPPSRLYVKIRRASSHWTEGFVLIFQEPDETEEQLIQKAEAVRQLLEARDLPPNKESA